MGKLTVKRRKSKSPQIGDMRTRIRLMERAITPPVFGTANFTESYTEVAQVWSKVDTVVSSSRFTGGNEIFSNVGVDESITDLFTIRYRTDIDTENIVNYTDPKTAIGYNYEIKSTDDPDKRQRFLVLYCVLMGEDTLEANQ